MQFLSRWLTISRLSRQGKSRRLSRSFGKSLQEPRLWKLSWCFCVSSASWYYLMRSHSNSRENMEDLVIDSCSTAPVDVAMLLWSKAKLSQSLSVEAEVAASVQEQTTLQETSQCSVQLPSVTLVLCHSRAITSNKTLRTQHHSTSTYELPWGANASSGTPSLSSSRL